MKAAGKAEPAARIRRVVESARHSKNLVIGLDGGEAVQELTLVFRFDVGGETPAGLGETGPLKNGERGPEADGGRGVRVREEIAEGADGVAREVMHFIRERF